MSALTAAEQAYLLAAISPRPDPDCEMCDGLGLACDGQGNLLPCDCAEPCPGHGRHAWSLYDPEESGYGTPLNESTLHRFTAACCTNCGGDADFETVARLQVYMGVGFQQEAIHG